MSWPSAGPICWSGCTGRSRSTGAAKCRRARRRSTRRRCSTSMPARVSVLYSRLHIGSAQRFPEARRLTPEDIEALDMLQRTGGRPRIAARHEFHAGRHPVPAQPHDPARPLGLRGLARGRAQAPPVAAVARPAGRAGRCRRSLPNATAASRSATAAASSARERGCTHRWCRAERSRVRVALRRKDWRARFRANWFASLARRSFPLHIHRS